MNKKDALKLKPGTLCSLQFDDGVCNGILVEKMDRTNTYNDGRFLLENGYQSSVEYKRIASVVKSSVF